MGNLANLYGYKKMGGNLKRFKMVNNRLLEFETLMQMQKNKLTGSFFTPEIVGRRLSKSIAARYFSKKNSLRTLSICDPFCGDGRLVCWFIEALIESKIKPSLNVELWDINPKYAQEAKEKVRVICEKNNLSFDIKAISVDSFVHAHNERNKFDVIITNPPWFILKPDSRHMNNLIDAEKENYKNHIMEYSKKIARLYSHSIPSKSWAGWNINFARVGVEASLNLIKKSGFCGIVSPESLLADTRSKLLRAWMLNNFSPSVISHYPAESKLFDKVDQNFITVVFTNKTKSNRTRFISYDKKGGCNHEYSVRLTHQFLKSLDNRIPVNYSEDQLKLLQKLMKGDQFSNLKKFTNSNIWTGRELDETRYKEKLSKSGTIELLKGKDITSGSLKYTNSGLIDTGKYNREYGSMAYSRLIWRDVSRPSQKRRVQSTIIPPGPMTGNSLNVLHSNSKNYKDLYSLYGIFSSLVFEFQAKALLATNHVSLGTIKLCKIPKYNKKFSDLIKELVDEHFCGNKVAEIKYNILIARAYGLSYDEFSNVIDSFSKFSREERENYLDLNLWESSRSSND